MGRQSSFESSCTDCVLYDVGQVLSLLLVVMMSDVIACSLCFFFFFPFHSSSIYLFIFLLSFFCYSLFYLMAAMNECYLPATRPRQRYLPATILSMPRQRYLPATLYYTMLSRPRQRYLPATSSHIDTLTANQLVKPSGYAKVRKWTSFRPFYLVYRIVILMDSTVKTFYICCYWNFENSPILRCFHNRSVGS